MSNAEEKTSKASYNNNNNNNNITYGDRSRQAMEMPSSFRGDKYIYVAFVKRKEQIINNFQKSCFSAVTWTICWLTSIVKIVRVEVGRNLG